MSNKDGGYVLPSIIDPDRICVQLYIPNEMNHLLAFWAQIEELGSALNWGNDLAHTALPVSAVWRDVYRQARDNFYEGGCMVDPCCPETNDKLDGVNANLKAIIDMLAGGATISFNAPVNSGDFSVDCTPDTYTGNEGETPPERLKRQNALCLAVNRWLVSILGSKADKMNKTNLLSDIWALGGFTSPPKMYAQIKYIESAFTIAQLQSVIDHETAFQTVACLIIQELSDEGNTFSIFKKLLADVYDELAAGEEVEQTLVAWVARDYATDRVNYTLFSRELERAYEDIEDGDDYACLCFGGTCDPDEFELIPVNDCTITKIDATHWNVIQTNYTDAPPDKRQFTAIFRDKYNRCYNYYASDMGQSGYDSYNCSGVHISGGGGGTSSNIETGYIWLEYDVDPVVGLNAILTIICP